MTDLPGDEALTRATLPPTPRHTLSSTASAPSAAFAAGTMVASRYRIVAPLGKGGMGEVFRADDLELGVSVALKFLPREVALDPVRLDRLRGEVRLARQVSHPHVCRVFDLVTSPDAAFGPFVSMEYVDGEDLGTLLRRVGRLSQERAVDVARQLCFGLAAAHEQGLVHRDIKPANVMIDGRGNARIMDFGVAGLASEFAAAPGQAPRQHVAAGTPAYMAPEQLDNREVTPRSDIYALGLVLFELFTGKPALNTAAARTLDDLKALHRTTTTTRPTDLVADLDPAVEAVILRCLAHSPADRPPSALAVAASLPGGDPIRAALAAGELPSPELIARSGATGFLSPRVAWSLVAVVLASLIALGVIRDRMGLHRRLPYEFEPTVMASKVRAMLPTLSFTERPDNEAWGYFTDNRVIQYIQQLPAKDRWDHVADGQPSPLIFWYRSQPSKLIPTLWWQRSVFPDNPPMERGSLTLRLDTAGRLLHFERFAPEEGFPPVGNAEPATPDWSPFFKAAGLDPAALTPVASDRVPRYASDTRFAWTGTYPTEPDMTLRVEAASLMGVPTSFRLFGPWPTTSPQGNVGPLGVVISALMMCGIVAALLLARANIRARRSDRSGATRVALALLISEYAALILPRHTIAGIFSFDLMGRPFARALWIAALTWLLYVALEPIVRRFWPQILVSWSRLLSGNWRDPLVARDMLLGCAIAAPFNALLDLGQSRGGAEPIFFDYWHHCGALFSLSQSLTVFSSSVVIPLLIVLLLVGVKVIARVSFIAYAVAAIVLAGSFFGGYIDGGPSTMAIAILASAVAIIVLIRVGFLAFAACMLTMALLSNISITTDLSAWYAPTALAYAAGVVALTVWAARRATARTLA